MTDSSLANVTETNTISWKLPLTHSILALDFKFQNIHIKKKKNSIIRWLSFMTFSYSWQLSFSFFKNKTNRKAAVVLYKLSFFFFFPKKKKFPFLTFQY